jgi:drug/metabolite transporter (DMT)-like permease
MLFGKAWKKANGFGNEEPQEGAGRIFGISFILCLVMAINLAMFLHDPKTDLIWGATAGFLAGFGWAAMGLGVVSLFERRPWSYMLINGGYLTVALTLMGAILGGWR